MYRQILFLLFSFCLFTANAQQDSLKTDTPKKEKKKRPKKIYPTDTSYHHSSRTATLLSTFVPGAGQMYNEYGYRKYRSKKNRAWWKVPLVWGGLGTLGYFYYYNFNQSKLLKEEYRWRDKSTIAYHHPQFANLTSLSAVESEFSFISGRRDLFLFLTIGFYGLQIVEALVDAHFVTFDVSENLSFQWTPMIFDQSTAGLNVSLKF